MYGNDKGTTCGVNGCICGEPPPKLNLCHGCGGFGWVLVDSWARLCPVCEGSGEYYRVYKIQELSNSNTTNATYTAQ